MKILFVTSEAAPFAASGGLGDVLGALPPAIKEEGCEASVILPLYSSIKDEVKASFTKEYDITFRLAWRNTGASIYKCERGGVSYYFVENHYYFDRGAKLYGEYDDGERFAFFSMAVIEFMKQTDNIPDILHANDLQTALTVIYLKTLYRHDKRLSGVKTVYTVHNIEYQGKYDPYILGDVFSLDASFYPILEFDGCINLTKGALVTSDYLTTVSPNYAYELRYDFFAFGLANIIESVGGKMSGVINGIDYSAFSPKNGADIYKSYTARTRKAGKAANKAALYSDLGLEFTDAPLIVMITRLTAGKGIDLVLQIADKLLMNDIKLVVLGTGEAEYEDAFRALECRYPDKVRALIKFDRAVSKKMYAAADIFLMPSKSEPCGLAQMIACSYGTVPVVRSVGGLYDSIIPYGEDGANGFRFDNYDARELLSTLERACAIYSDKKAWGELTASAMSSDFTWKRSASKYIEIYENLLNW